MFNGLRFGSLKRGLSSMIHEAIIAVYDKPLIN